MCYQHLILVLQFTDNLILIAILNSEQLQFLNHHKINVDETFDATGMQRQYYQELMKGKNKLIAYGVEPCKKFGHTLRTVSGHCIQCQPECLAHLKRHFAQGFVYIAGSISLQCIKVGFTLNPLDRAVTINKTNYGYGNVNDWQLLCKCEFNEAGMIENEIQKLLHLYRMPNKYAHDGHQQETQELFSCGYPKAFEALRKIKVIYPSHFKTIQEFKHKIEKYSFPNRISVKNL